MQPEPVAMIIADISGYTRFMLQHAKALRHSQMVVSGLLAAITDEPRDVVALAAAVGADPADCWPILLHLAVNRRDVRCAHRDEPARARFSRA